MKWWLVLVVTLLAGCGPIGTIGQITELRSQLEPAQSVSQLMDKMCNASYREVVRELGDKAPEFCQ